LEVIIEKVEVGIYGEINFLKNKEDTLIKLLESYLIDYLKTISSRAYNL